MESVPLSYFRHKRRFKDVKNVFWSKIKNIKKIQESSLNLVKNPLLSKEKPHFRRSTVWWTVQDSNPSYGFRVLLSRVSGFLFPPEARCFVPLKTL